MNLRRHPNELVALDAAVPGTWWGAFRREMVQLGLAEEAAPGVVGSKAGRALGRFDLLRNVGRLRGPLLYPTAWAGTKWLFPQGIWREPIIAGMDCWESDWDRWSRVLRRLRVRAAAFTSRQSAAEMARRCPGLHTLWMPEAAEVSQYSAERPLPDRSIDVLQMGRGYEAFDTPVRDHMKAAGCLHLQPQEGEHLFPDRTGLLDALGNARLLVCFPRCDTNPYQAGSVETLTLRYLEGFASGCVVVGRAPAELVDLFGYDPVVGVDPGPKSGERVLQIIREIGSFQPLVDRNLHSVRERGGWPDRARGFTRWLDDLGLHRLPATVVHAARESGACWADLFPLEQTRFHRAGLGQSAGADPGSPSEAH